MENGLVCMKAWHEKNITTPLQKHPDPYLHIGKMINLLLRQKMQFLGVFESFLFTKFV